MQKVLIFVQDGVGGAERMSVLIGKALAEEGKNITFCLLGNNASTSIRDFIPTGMDIISIPPTNPIKTIMYIISIIVGNKPDYVFSSVLNISNKILPFRFLFPKTRVIIRCDNYLYTYTKCQQYIIASLYPKADIIIGQTEEMTEELCALKKFRNNQIITLHNPVDVDTIKDKLNNKETPYPKNKFKHFVASGRFAHQKGFDLLIDAFARLATMRDDCDLYIVGDYEYDNRKVYNMINAKIHSLGISNRVHCLGYQSNPYPYIKFADCFVLSSRWEGLPNVLIEALYLGTPVATFLCIPIIRRLVEHGTTGFIAEKNDADSLANAMDKSINLGRIKSNYKSSSIKDFTKLFEYDK